MNHDVIIIGGGASGIIAALTAADSGADTAIIEGNDRIGKKILTTGNGRCNISNSNIGQNHELRYHSSNPGFYRTVLDSFTVADTKNMFYSLGLPLVTIEEGKMFPLSLQASSVLDILRFSVEERGISTYLNSKVKDIKKKGNSFIIIDKNNSIYKCKSVILACGGRSAPKTGSDGSGYDIAKKMGHSIIIPFPALVQLKLDYKHIRALSGIKFNGYAEIFVDNVSKRREYGEILFTDYGISGPPILQLSRTASESLLNGKAVTLTVDIMYTQDEKSLSDILEAHWAQFGYRSAADSFIGLINKKMIPILLKEAGIESIHKPCSNLECAEKEKIVSLLKHWKFNVLGTNSFSDSQVTAGGVDTREIDSKTLESKIVPGLYFSGELMDVDGDCGGFNLQWAWSSGFIAGKNAAKV